MGSSFAVMGKYSSTGDCWGNEALVFWCGDDGTICHCRISQPPSLGSVLERSLSFSSAAVTSAAHRRPCGDGKG